MGKLRITLLITASLESPPGLRYLPMAKALVQRGHEVTLLALHHDLKPTTRRTLEEEGVRVEYVGQMHVRKVGDRKFYYSPPALIRVALASTWRMAKRAVQLDCDLIHLGKPQPINGMAGLLGGPWLRRRRLYLDCDDYEAESNRFPNKWLRRAVVLFEDGLPRFSAGLTVNTRFTQDRYISRGVAGERIAYLPNGIDRDRFAMPAAALIDHLRRRWEVEGQQVAAYVGTLSLTGHAVDLLLDGFAQLAARHPHLVLLVVGGGEDYDRLSRQAAALGLGKAVRFTGWVPAAEVPAYLALADVTVDPVRDDLVSRARAPMKITESLAVGTPVVTGDVGDRREMLADGRAGVLVAPGDAQALADGLARVLDNPDLARDMRQAALIHREQYYWDSLIDVAIRLYERGS
ncbi:MAG: glycosyltransferase family 4 protein [Anaerolineae bacterium]|nr:glycosyltransferase family 4 protein [Anaerolineae bacterium]